MQTKTQKIDEIVSAPPKTWALMSAKARKDYLMKMADVTSSYLYARMRKDKKLREFITASAVSKPRAKAEKSPARRPRKSSPGKREALPVAAGESIASQAQSGPYSASVLNKLSIEELAGLLVTVRHVLTTKQNRIAELTRV